jgi:lysozyme
MGQVWSRLAGRLAGGLAVLGLAVLAGCGEAPPHRASGSAVASVVTPSFGDARPVNWPGRAPSAYPVHGIDVSKYQGSIDWATARAHGVNFAFIKATEGGDRLDSRFHEHWRGAREAGVARGAYHFYYFCTPAEAQARWFIANVPKERGMLPPVIDLEWNPQSPTCTYRPPAEAVRSEALTFMNILERHYGQRPVIYTDPGFFERNQLMRLAGEEVWLRSTAAHPTDRYGVAGWTFWQYSATGLIPGIGGEVDLNAFGGSRAEWLAWLQARAL